MKFKHNPLQSQRLSPSLSLLLLKPSEQTHLVESLLENLPVGFALVDTQGRYLLVNKSLAQLNGREVGEHIGKTFKDVIPEFAPQIEKYHQKVIKRGKSIEGVLFQSKKPGNGTQKRYWTMDIFPVYLSSEKIGGAGIFVQDITKRKVFESKILSLVDKLEEAEERYRTIFETVADGIFIFNTDGKYLNVNPAGEALLGYTKEEILTHSLGDYYAGDKDQYQQEIAEFIQKGTAQHREDIVRKKNGDIITLEGVVTPMKLGNKQLFLAIAKDITSRKEAEQRKDEFLSVASHELRTPVTSIRAFSQLLRRRLATKADQTSQYFLSKIDEQSQRICLLINDLLDVGRIETGRLLLQKRLCHCDDLVHSIVTEVKQSINHPISIEGTIPLEMELDTDRISQVLVNLLINAAKYSPVDKPINVILKEDGNEIRITVRDFGCGIPPEQLGKIFERYFRGEDTAHHKEGMGLGLYIAWEIMKAHGGKLTVESEVNEGSRFTIHLPIQSP